jgi:hypothetical protein
MERLDVDVDFRPAVEMAFGKEKVLVVKDAHPGQPIQRWVKESDGLSGHMPAANGDLYELLLQKVQIAMDGKKIRSITFLWMQGERDSRSMKNGSQYAVRLNALIEQIKTDLKYSEINYVLGRLSDYGINNEKAPAWTIIRDAQVEIAEKSVRGAWVNTEDLNDGINVQGHQIENDLHYSVEGYRLLGQRLAEAAISLVKINDMHVAVK